jgi:hypothetical protein
MVTVLIEVDEKGDVVLPASVLQIYQQLPNKHVTSSADNQFAGRAPPCRLILLNLCFGSSYLHRQAPHVHNDMSERGNYGRKMTGNSADNGDLHAIAGICDMGPTALLPLRRHAEAFFDLKNPTASAGFEPANLGTKGQHATPRPPKPLG